MADLYVGHKKYSILQKEVINNEDINIIANGNYTPTDGYTGFGVVRVQVPEFVYGSITIDPKTTQQTFNPPPEIDGYNEIIVNAVTNDIDANIKPENIKDGVTILGVTGNFDYITDDITINPSLEEQTFKPTHDGFGTITVNPVTNEIDPDIKPENILQGVSILGVEGAVIESKETTRDITANGIYIPEAPYTGFSEVNVDVRTIQEPLHITPTIEDQTFTAEDDYHGYTPVTVDAVTANIDENIKPENILEGVTILGVEGTVVESNEQTLHITKNGTYTPDEGYTGFSEVSVDINTVNNTDITITENGTYTPDPPYTGFGQVTVETDIKTQAITITIDENSETSFIIYPDPEYDAFSAVGVDLTWVEEQLKALNAGDVPLEPVLQDKTVTQDGTYTADSGYDGLGTVTVDLSWVDTKIESLASNYTNTTVDAFLTDSLQQLNTDALVLRDYACYNMASLREVTLTSCQSIGSHVFEGSNLKTLTILSPSLCTLEMADLPDGVENIYVPETLVDTYKEAENWSTYSSIISAILN